jgi:hypothetical protein
MPLSLMGSFKRGEAHLHGSQNTECHIASATSHIQMAHSCEGLHSRYKAAKAQDAIQLHCIL